MLRVQSLSDPAGIKWFEWPLLTYFAFHFFPPAPPPLASLCLVLGVFGALWEKKHFPYLGLKVLSRPIVWAWCLFAGLMYASLLQVPTDLLMSSWNKLNGSFLKGGLMGLALALYLDSPERARRLLLAGVGAGTFILLHCIFDTARGIYTTGNLPFQRDYLFWLTVFFPFALAASTLEQRSWRIAALFSAAGTLALATLVGFRGATVALLSMFLLYSVFIRRWHVLLVAAGLTAIGVGGLAIWFPIQTNYLLAKFLQMSDSERFSGHWLPAWDMAMLKPWTGHGFGHEVFSYQFVLHRPDHPQWTMNTGVLPRGQHSIVFETLFSSGWPGLVIFLLISAILIASLFSILSRHRNQIHQDHWLLLALALLVSYIGNFLIFYQLETPSWRTLPIVVAITAAIQSARKA